MADDRREHERIDIEMRTRLWLNENYRGRQIEFEGYSETQNLSIGGTFLTSSYLLPVGFPINIEMETGGGQILAARGEIVHSEAENQKNPGMGVIFTEVDAENRERLLRFFVSDRIRDFYSGRFIREFPHLESVLSLEDVALVINLWEDKEMRLSGLKKR
ncbi:MAG: PilZ domain-containing protein [Myxococcota bacterium]